MVDMWFPYIQSMNFDGTGIQLQLPGWETMRLQIPEPDYWFVMLNKVAYGRLIFPPALAAL